MNKYLIAIIGLFGFLAPLLSYSQTDSTVFVRIETRDTHIGDGVVVLSDEPCEITSRTQHVTKSFSGDRAICAFDVLAQEIGLKYVVEFFGENALLKGFRYDNQDYATSIWFAVNHDFSPEHCDPLWGVSLSTCDLSDGDELVVLHDQSSFYPFLQLEQTGDAVVGDDVLIVVRDAVSGIGIPGAVVQCGQVQGISGVDGILALMFLDPGTYTCVAEKVDHYRSKEWIVEVKEPEDEVPVNDPIDDLPDDVPDSNQPKDDSDEPDLESPDDPNDQEPIDDPSDNFPEQDPAENFPSDPIDPIAPTSPDPVRVSLDDRYAAALIASGYLRRLQIDTGDIVDVSVSPWAAIAYASIGRAPYDVHDGGRTLDQALMALDSASLADALSVSRTMLGLMASGRDVKNIYEHNYCSQLLSFYDGRQIGDPALLNDDLFVVLALEVCDEQDLQVAIAERVLRQRQGDGGFGFEAKGQASVDMTAIAIQALDVAGVNIPEDTIQYVLNLQQPNGGFPYAEGFPSNTASTAWAIQALIAADVDVHGVAHSETGQTPWSYLIAMQLPDGGFPWQDGELADARMTAYVIPALMGRSLPLIGDWGTLPSYDAAPVAEVVAVQDSVPSGDRFVAASNSGVEAVSQENDALDEPVVLGEGIAVDSSQENGEKLNASSDDPRSSVPDVRYAYLLLVIVGGESLLHSYRTLQKRG